MVQISIGFLVCLLRLHVKSFLKLLFIKENNLRRLYKQIFMIADVQLRCF